MLPAFHLNKKKRSLADGMPCELQQPIPAPCLGGACTQLALVECWPSPGHSPRDDRQVHQSQPPQSAGFLGHWFKMWTSSS